MLRVCVVCGCLCALVAASRTNSAVVASLTHSLSHLARVTQTVAALLRALGSPGTQDAHHGSQEPIGRQFTGLPGDKALPQGRGWRSGNPSKGDDRGPTRARGRGRGAHLTAGGRAGGAGDAEELAHQPLNQLIQGFWALANLCDPLLVNLFDPDLLLADPSLTTNLVLPWADSLPLVTPRRGGDFNGNDRGERDVADAFIGEDFGVDPERAGLSEAVWPAGGRGSGSFLGSRRAPSGLIS